MTKHINGVCIFERKKIMGKLKTKKWDRVHKTTKVYRSRKLEQEIIDTHKKMCAEIDSVRKLNPLNL